MIFSGWLQRHEGNQREKTEGKMSRLYNVNSRYAKCRGFFAIFNEIEKWACNFAENGLSYRKQRETSFIIGVSNKGVPRVFLGHLFLCTGVRKENSCCAARPLRGWVSGVAENKRKEEER